MSDEIAIAAMLERMIHPPCMNGSSRNADRDTFHIAIREAASRHPSIAQSPKQIRSARLSLLIAKARTLASMTSRPLPGQKNDAEQMVEDAALLLGYQSQRSIPVLLATTHVYSSPDVEAEILSEPMMMMIGLNTPEGFARFKDALIRAALIGLSDAADPNKYEPGTRKAIRAMLSMLIHKHVSIDQLDDCDLIEMAQDVIARIATTDGEK